MVRLYLTNTMKMSRRPLFLLFLVLLVSCTAAQPAPPPSRFVSVNFNPMVVILIVIVFSAIFFVIFFSIYIIECTSSPTEPAAATGRATLPKGLEREVIMGFPTFVYSNVKDHGMPEGAMECAVCLCEFEEYETIRLIPNCDHVFHPECIDEWLSGHVTCPVCRANLARDRTGGWSGAEEHDRVEIDIDDEPTVEPEEGIEVARDLARESESHTGKPPHRMGRSHSTGHSLVRSWDDTERFTPSLPEEVRKQIMEPPMTPYFPSEGSTDDGSSRGRFLRRLERMGRSKSERWFFSKMPSFLGRVSSMDPPKFANSQPPVGTDPSVKSGEPATEHDRPPI